MRSISAHELGDPDEEANTQATVEGLIDRCISHQVDGTPEERIMSGVLTLFMAVAETAAARLNALFEEGEGEFRMAELLATTAGIWLQETAKDPTAEAPRFANLLRHYALRPIDRR